MTAFDTFWQHYPLRIAKGAARLAFARALRKTTLETILTALEAYKKHKPEDRPWCHASTWLNQERWEDEWEPPPTIVPQPLFRPARTPEEMRAYLRSVGKPISPEIERARTVDELPAFARMVPVEWNPNVVQMRKAVTP